MCYSKTNWRQDNMSKTHLNTMVFLMIVTLTILIDSPESKGHFANILALQSTLIYPWDAFFGQGVGHIYPLYAQQLQGIWIKKLKKIQMPRYGGGMSTPRMLGWNWLIITSAMHLAKMHEEKHFTRFFFIVCVHLITCNLNASIKFTN